MKGHLLINLFMGFALVLIGGCKQDHHVPQLLSDKEITSFSLPAATNATLTGDIAVELDGDTIRGQIFDAEDIRALKADFTFKGIRVTVDGQPQSSGVESHDFTTPVTYEVMAQDSSVKRYVVIIKHGFPVLHITTSQPITSKDDYVDGTLDIGGNVADSNLYSGHILIRGRGNSTWTFPKKPYKIKLDKKAPLLGMAAEKSWVLLANYGDISLMRNELAFTVSRMLGMAFTSSAKYVEVVLNGDTLGNYQLVLPIDVSGHQVDVKEQEEGATSLPEISGGYLLEVDGYAGGEDQHFYTPRQQAHPPIGVTMHYPEDGVSPAQHDYIQQYVTAFENALYSEQFTDPDKGYKKYFDVDSYVNYYLINEILGNPDMYWSTYMYKDRDDGRLYSGPIWDFDLACNDDERIGDATLKLMRDHAYYHEIWGDRLMEDPALRKAVTKRWNAIKDQINTLPELVNKLQKQLALSGQRNVIRWPELLKDKIHLNPYIPSSYEDEVDHLKTYLQTRLPWLNETFNGSRFQ